MSVDNDVGGERIYRPEQGWRELKVQRQTVSGILSFREMVGGKGSLQDSSHTGRISSVSSEPGVASI